MLGLWNEKIYSWEYIEELNQRLVYIRDCVERQVIPGRHPQADSPGYYECHFVSDLFQAECPWREDCWKEELEYERRPAVLVADADGIVRELVLLKERRCELDKESRELTKRIKELQKRLDPFFDEFGDRIMAGGVVIERVLVKVPERQQKAFGYLQVRGEVKLKVSCRGLSPASGVFGVSLRMRAVSKSRTGNWCAARIKKKEGRALSLGVRGGLLGLLVPFWRGRQRWQRHKRR